MKCFCGNSYEVYAVKLMQFELSGDDDLCSNYTSFRIIVTFKYSFLTLFFMKITVVVKKLALVIQ